jgi:WS/DGAT/MGAT family acyltransferase
MFLYNETARTPMHVGSIQYLEVDASQRDSYFDDFKAMLLDRIHLVTYLTSKVDFAPFNIDHPVWIRDTGFDIDRHLFRVRLPEGSTVKDVEQRASKLYEPLMDRSKPLWEIHVFEGLADGQVAILQKTHHAAIDGMSSVKAAELLFDFTEVPRTVEPASADFWNADKPNYAQHMDAAYRNIARYWREGVSRVPAMARTASITGARLLTRAWTPMPTNAPKTRLNGSVDEGRAFAQVPFSLSAIKAVGKSRGVKVNDVTLAICGEGLKRYLEEKGEKVSDSLIASCPVSLHKAGDGSISNQVSSINVAMCNDVADFSERLLAIHDSANNSKAMLSEASDAMPTDFGGFGLPAVMQLMARAGESGIAVDMAPRMPMNVVVSNVPGFQVPLFVAGARLISQMPMSIVAHGSAVNLTVTSYLDRLDLGITVATRRVPDIEVLAAKIQAAYEDILAERSADADHSKAVSDPLPLRLDREETLASEVDDTVEEPEYSAAAA